MAPTTRGQTAKIAGFPDVRAADNSLKNRKSRRVQAGPSRGKSYSKASNGDDSIPTYQIDLSQPPIERYVELAREFREEFKELPTLFDELVESVNQSPETAHRWARRLIRGLHSKEQTDELRGISKAVDIPLYLLVCFNTVLDLLMGCSSGGMLAKSGDDEPRMLHYRTLDWGMDPLRKIVVQLEFITKPKGPVVARTITYVGFVGVLTGVRENLSMSLNFRPYHNNSNSIISNIRFYGHLLLVLLGIRPSISSTLRDVLFGPGGSCSAPPDLQSTIRDLPAQRTTAAYIIMSDGRTTAVFEKDLTTAKVTTSSTFIACTNHDTSADTASTASASLSDGVGQRALLINEDFLLDSVDRKQCMSEIWQRHVPSFQMRHPAASDDEVYARDSQVVKWVQRWPISNEMTHFACVMDPAKGEIVWAKRWVEPLQEPGR